MSAETTLTVVLIRIVEFGLLPKPNHSDVLAAQSSQANSTEN